MSLSYFLFIDRKPVARTYVASLFIDIRESSISRFSCPICLNEDRFTILSICRYDLTYDIIIAFIITTIIKQIDWKTFYTRDLVYSTFNTYQKVESRGRYRFYDDE